MVKLHLHQGLNEFGPIRVEVEGQKARVYEVDARSNQVYSVLKKDCPPRGGRWFARYDVDYVCRWRSLNGHLRGQILEIVTPYLEERERLKNLGRQVEVEDKSEIKLRNGASFTVSGDVSEEDRLRHGDEEG